MNESGKTTQSEQDTGVRKNILVVDDESAFLLALKKIFEGEKMHVEIAETLEKAMELLDDHSFHAAILDIRLTGVLAEEGFEILERIKRDHPSTLKIVLTGYGSDEVMERAYVLGADYYFEKPVAPHNLRALIEAGTSNIAKGGSHDG
ncbi:MAG: response regulator [Nitrospirae bacterium]|nr:response regulator [Nitrospirota bacterium]